LKIAGVINGVFRPQKTLKKTIIKLYITLALPAILYGIENWAVIARDARRITAAEMKYVRTTTGCTWTEYETNTEIKNELNITQICTNHKTTENTGYTIYCIQNASKQSTVDNKELQTERQKEPGETIEEASGCERP
jgi:hypothetical protein